MAWQSVVVTEPALGGADAIGAAGLARVRALVAEVGATALVVSDGERVLLEVGDPAVPVHCRSIRKTLAGSMFGRAVLEGRLDLDATLDELRIDDSVPPPLTAFEKRARVRDLLTCRSGVYHPANHAGPDGGVSGLPPRGSSKPGERFVYNNWDFNALGTILERALGRSLFDEFAETIAGASEMQDFDLGKQRYATQRWSEHPTYAFHISTRDLARFGRLYLNQGRYRDRQVIPAKWAMQSTCAHAMTARGPGNVGPAYGYLWWVALRGQLFAGTVLPDGSTAAYGAGSQFLLVIPKLDRVIALLADPTRPKATNRATLRPKLAEIVTRVVVAADRAKSDTDNGRAPATP